MGELELLRKKLIERELLNGADYAKEINEINDTNWLYIVLKENIPYNGMYGLSQKELESFRSLYFRFCYEDPQDVDYGEDPYLLLISSSSTYCDDSCNYNAISHVIGSANTPNTWRFKKGDEQEMIRIKEILENIGVTYCNAICNYLFSGIDLVSLTNKK